MTKKVLIMAANGQIARIVTTRLLSESQFQDVELTLFLRNASRLTDWSADPRVTVMEGSLDDYAAVLRAVTGQDIVLVAVVDHTEDNHQTTNVIKAMQAAHVDRVIYTNVLGIYGEVPGEFGSWNAQTIGSAGLKSALHSDQLLEQSGLNYTTLRLPWLNDRDIKYTVTHRHEPYDGVSGSRQSIADVIVKIIADPQLASNDSIGIADPATQGRNRPVY